MKKVTLIWPKWKDRGAYSVSFFKIPPLGLLQLASLTPENWEVEIIDENITPINFDAPTDLVGLSAMTSLAPQAYAIAAEYQKRKVPTVMGGIHASFLPEEALRHVDSVVIGEADEVWGGILKDFERSGLKRTYHATPPPSLDFRLARPVSRTFSINLSKFLPIHLPFAYIQAQRGCPIGCEFCSVTKFNGKRIRSKSIPYLLQEIEREMERNFRYLMLVDDNIIANPRFAKELFGALKGLGVKWASQTDIRIADEDFLDLACEGGLKKVFLGLESIQPGILRTSVARSKNMWRPKYEMAIKRLHSHGVFVEASFILGFDGDNDETVERTIDWALEQGVETAQFTIATPMPGTKFFSDLDAAGRIFTRDWSRFSGTECVFKPLAWTPEELEERLHYAYRKFYSFTSIARRLLRPSLEALALATVNLDIRGLWQI